MDYIYFSFNLGRLGLLYKVIYTGSYFLFVGVGAVLGFELRILSCFSYLGRKTAVLPYLCAKLVSQSL
jgi:hypothetical protein